MDRQTDRQTDHNTPLPYQGGVTTGKRILVGFSVDSMKHVRPKICNVETSVIMTISVVQTVQNKCEGNRFERGKSPSPFERGNITDYSGMIASLWI